MAAVYNNDEHQYEEPKFVPVGTNQLHIETMDKNHNDQKDFQCTYGCNGKYFVSKILRFFFVYFFIYFIFYFLFF